MSIKLINIKGIKHFFITSNLVTNIDLDKNEIKKYAILIYSLELDITNTEIKVIEIVSIKSRII